MTGAELPLERKNELSHRGKAMRALIAKLRSERARPEFGRCNVDAMTALAKSGPDPTSPQFSALPPLVAVRPHPVVRAEVPVLRFQFARSARRRCPRTRTSMRCSPTSSARCRRSGAARSSSIFIGGGTPSLFSARSDRPAARRHSRAPAAAARRRDHARSQSGHVRAREVRGLLRAPASIACRSASRASIRRHLQALGRVHDADEARRAAEAALMIFGNVNFDLMYALPRADASTSAQADLAAALAFAPPHLSFYQLTLEPNTLFHRHPPPLPDEDTAADIEDAVHATLGARGLRALRDVRVREAGPHLPRTISTTGSSATISASAPARTRSFRSPTASCARCAGSSRKQYLEKIAGGRAAAWKRREVRARRRRLRVHAERAAADRRRCERRCSPSAPAIRSRSSRRRSRGRTRRGLLDPDPSRIAADRARPPLPERPASSCSCPRRRRIRSRRGADHDSEPHRMSLEATGVAR